MPTEKITDATRADVQAMLWSLRLSSVTRFLDQRFWERESVDAKHALSVEPPPRLESVAEHSWHVADCVLMLAKRFRSLDVGRCVSLAILHDKLEILTGDWPAWGRLSESSGVPKSRVEEGALTKYLEILAPSSRTSQRTAILEFAQLQTTEARFVKAVDKLQVLLFMIAKKKGAINDEHLAFSLEYARKALDYFPRLGPHYAELSRLLVKQVAETRGQTMRQVKTALRHPQARSNPPVRLPNVAIYGPSGSGKSTVCNHLISRWGYFHCHPGAICRKLCWYLFESETKTTLNAFSDAVRAIDQDVWLRTTLTAAPKDRPLVFDGMRFQRDWDYFRAAGYQLWRTDATAYVRRSRLTERGQQFAASDEQHAGETERKYFNFDVVLSNEGSIDDLKASVDDALEKSS